MDQRFTTKITVSKEDKTANPICKMEYNIHPGDIILFIMNCVALFLLLLMYLISKSETDEMEEWFKNDKLEGK